MHFLLGAAAVAAGFKMEVDKVKNQLDMMAFHDTQQAQGALAKPGRWLLDAKDKKFLFLPFGIPSDMKMEDVRLFTDGQQIVLNMAAVEGEEHKQKLTHGMQKFEMMIEALRADNPSPEAFKEKLEQWYAIEDNPAIREQLKTYLAPIKLELAQNEDNGFGSGFGSEFGGFGGFHEHEDMADRFAAIHAWTSDKSDLSDGSSSDTESSEEKPKPKKESRALDWEHLNDDFSSSLGHFMHRHHHEDSDDSSSSSASAPPAQESAPISSDESSSSSSMSSMPGMDGDGTITITLNAQLLQKWGGQPVVPFDAPVRVKQTVAIEIPAKHIAPQSIFAVLNQGPSGAKKAVVVVPLKKHEGHKLPKGKLMQIPMFSQGGQPISEI